MRGVELRDTTLVIKRFMTNDFFTRTPKLTMFGSWAVLGEGCSSARDFTSWSPGALYFPARF